MCTIFRLKYLHAPKSVSCARKYSRTLAHFLLFITLIVCRIGEKRMKIVVLNGSPKGDDSVTIHSVKYLQKKIPQHEFIFHNIAQRIRGIERRSELFDEIIGEIKLSDAVLWAFPLRARIM